MDRTLTTRNRTSLGAFTFVEVLVALAVVSVALLALIRMHLVSLNAADAANARANAVLLAQERIDHTLAAGFPEIGVDAGTAAAGNLELKWRTEVAEFRPDRLAGDEIAPMRRLCVEVAWNRGARPERLTISTCVADRKLQ